MSKHENTQRIKKKILTGIFGFATGLVNGFFGSGGGMLAVEALEQNGLDSRQAHASSILLILPLSIVSTLTYFSKNHIPLSADHIALLGGAAAGGILGALLLGKLSSKWIDRLFTGLMLLSGIRMLLR